MRNATVTETIKKTSTIVTKCEGYGDRNATGDKKIARGFGSRIAKVKRLYLQKKTLYPQP